MTVVSAASVAARFVHLSQSDNVCDLTNLKLQKLVVFVESMSLAILGDKAIVEPVQAWNNGPAIKPLYGLYKKYSDSPILSVEHSYKSQRETVSRVTSAIVDEVWDMSKGLTAADLWDITHTVGPWPNHFVPEVKDIILPTQELALAWEDYSRLALKKSLAREYRVQHEVVGAGNLDNTRWGDYQQAVETFRVTRPEIGVA